MGDRPQTSAIDPFSELLDLLGIELDEHVSVCCQEPGGPFRYVHATRADAPGEVARLADTADVWFSVNPIRPPRSGRGSDADVTRCVALFADIDLKAGGVTNADTAATITKEVAAALGQPATAVVFSGHGGHTYWTLDPDDEAWTLDTDAKRAAAQAVYRRGHRLVADIAERFGGRVDNVGQLSRVLRVPGSHNRKDPDHPVLVELTPYPFGTGGPLSFREVIEVLDAYGVPEVPEDRIPPGAVVSDAARWEFGTTSAYVAAMVDGWQTDRPASRHGWLVSQATRLSCAHRLGRISHADHKQAVETLRERFEYLLTTHGTVRRPTPGEVSGALAWGVTRTASMTEEQAADEIGGPLDDPVTLGTPDASGEGGLNLPESFWRARTSLDHIRRAAWSRMTPPDAVLAAVLAEVSACIPPSVRVDTGILTPVPIHHFGGLVGPSGGFKSTAMTVAAEVVQIVNGWSTDPYSAPDGLLIAEEDDGVVPHRWPLGSGQGTVEAYMGTRRVGPPDGRGNPRPVRRQVRSNVLLSSDEGNDLVKACADQNSIVGEVVRTLWSGKLAGQGNAKIENRRIVHAGRYTLAVLAGFQVSVLARFLSEDELSKGTPQRFLFAYSVAPDVPTEAVEDPGPLEVLLPTRTITLCDELRERVRHDHYERLTGATRLAPLESQRPAMVARVAALLAILDGRGVITVEDWQLAEVMFETSLRVARHAIAERNAKATKAKQAERASTLAAEVEAEDAKRTPEGRVSLRILGYLADAGGRAKWSGDGGLHKRFNGDEYRLARSARDQLAADGRIKVTQAGRSEFVERIA